MDHTLQKLDESKAVRIRAVSTFGFIETNLPAIQADRTRVKSYLAV